MEFVFYCVECNWMEVCETEEAASRLVLSTQGFCPWCKSSWDVLDMGGAILLLEEF